MRKSLGTAAVALAGLMFGLGGGTEEDGNRLLIVYSTDERGELHPCG